jgi:hypothetical protein
MATNPPGYDKVMGDLNDLPRKVAAGLQQGLRKAAIMVRDLAKDYAPKSPAQNLIDDDMRRRKDSRKRAK